MHGKIFSDLSLQILRMKEIRLQKRLRLFFLNENMMEIVLFFFEKYSQDFRFTKLRIKNCILNIIYDILNIFMINMSLKLSMILLARIYCKIRV